MNDIELPPLPDLLEKAIVHFAQACLYSEAESRRASAENLKRAVKAYARAAVEADRAQRVPDVAEIRRVLACVKSSVDSGIPVTDGWRILDALLASTPAPAQQEPDCPRCKGSGEDPEGYFDQSRGPDGDTYDGPCRDCAGTGAAQHQEPPQQERKPMTYREIADATSEWAHVRSDYTIGIIRAAERHHGIKE